MNKILLILLSSFILSFFGLNAQTNPSHVYVSGYTKSNGTYVEGYYRTAPNSTNRDNFSTVGNVNPYTAQPGWIQPDNNPMPSYSTGSTYNYTYSSSGTSTQGTSSPKIYPYSTYTSYSTTSNLNLRSGAGTGYSIETTIPSGNSVQVITYGSSGWWYVMYAGQYGYVYSAYLSLY